VSEISLHAGVSRGVAGRLHSPAVDARDLAAAAAACGFDVQRVLIDPTADEFVSELRLAVTRVHRGDTLLITFSGHGRNASWCFFDRDLPLLEVCRLLVPLPRGTFVRIVADACHSEAWSAIDVPLRAEVTVIAPAEVHARDGKGRNTRSPFTAALIREWMVTLSVGTPPPPGARSCSGTGARRRR